MLVVEAVGGTDGEVVLTGREEDADGCVDCSASFVEGGINGASLDVAWELAERERVVLLDPGCRVKLEVLAEGE